jgi:hypothetical protein
VKRLYVLGAIAALQIVLGSLTLLGAAQPVRMSQEVLTPSGGYYEYGFGILGPGRLSGNFSELDRQSVELLVLDDPGYTAFRGGSTSFTPLFNQTGITIGFDVSLPGSGQYHVVAVSVPTRQALQVSIDLVVVGLKTDETVIAIIVLVGGEALVAASLMLSVSSWRRAGSARTSSADSSSDPPLNSASDPAPDPPAPSSSDPQDSVQDPPDDDTRIY